MDDWLDGDVAGRAVVGRVMVVTAVVVVAVVVVPASGIMWVLIKKLWMQSRFVETEKRVSYRGIPLGKIFIVTNYLNYSLRLKRRSSCFYNRC